MTATRSVGITSCRGTLGGDSVESCLGRQSGSSVHWWAQDPTAAEASAAFHGVELRAMLCPGCANLYDQLVVAGRWNP